MKFRSHLTAAIGALLALSAGCTDALPTETLVVPPPAAAPSPTCPAFQNLSRPGEIYAFRAADFAPHDCTVIRYVLFQDSTLAWQSSDPKSGIIEEFGRYSRADSAIVFTWINPTKRPGSSWQHGGPATATMRADTLLVHFYKSGSGRYRRV